MPAQGMHRISSMTMRRARLAAMRAYDEALGLFGDDGLTEVWRRQLALMLDDDQVAPAVAGLCLRRLHDLRIWDEATVAAAFSRHTVGQPPLLAGGFLESFLSGGAEIILQDRPLLNLVDAWLCDLGEEDFIEALRSCAAALPRSTVTRASGCSTRSVRACGRRPAPARWNGTP